MAPYRYRYGLFDVDCREHNSAGDGLSFRPRVAPIVPQLQRLYGWQQQHGWPLIFTTCCSGRMPAEGDLDGVCHVPLAEDPRWRRKVEHNQHFYLAKKSHGDPKINMSCRAFDVFQDNHNAVELLRRLKVQQWVVFGNGFDLCVRHTVLGLLRAGCSTTLLADVRISSASGTPASEAETLQLLEHRGATVSSLKHLLANAP